MADRWHIGRTPWLVVPNLGATSDMLPQGRKHGTQLPTPGYQLLATGYRLMYAFSTPRLIFSPEAAPRPLKSP